MRSSDLILNDQIRSNGVRSSDLILNDQIRSNGVRSSDLIVCSPVPSEVRKPIPTNPDRRTSEASPPVSDRKAFTNRTALVVQYAFDPERSVT